MSADDEVNSQKVDPSPIDGPWDDWMNALSDVLKAYDKISSDKASGQWFWWRVGHLVKGLEDAGCSSYAKWLMPNQTYLPAADPLKKPILVVKHLYPPPVNQPPHAEIAALRAVKASLEYVYDEPANNRTPTARESLSPDQKGELRGAEEIALREVNKRIRYLERTEKGEQRLVFDDLTHTVAVDGINETVGDVRAYQVYRAIVEIGSPGLTSNACSRLCKRCGCKSDPCLTSCIAAPKKLRNYSAQGERLRLGFE